MTDFNNLFFDELRKMYLIFGKAQCSFCKSGIREVAMVNIHWSRKSKYTFSCHNCIKKKDKEGKATEKARTTFWATIVDELPENCRPVFSMKPTLMESKEMSVFDAAFLESTYTIDRTKYALREPSLKGAQIGNDPEGNTENSIELSDRIKELDTPLKTKWQSEAYLNDLQEAVPLIEGVGKKRIENKEHQNINQNDNH